MFCPNCNAQLKDLSGNCYICGNIFNIFDIPIGFYPDETYGFYVRTDEFIKPNGEIDSWNTWFDPVSGKYTQKIESFISAKIIEAVKIMPEPEPEIIPEPEPEIIPEPEPEIIPEPELEIIPEPEPEIIPEPEPEIIPEPVPEIIPEPVLEIIPEPEPEIIPEPDILNGCIEIELLPAPSPPQIPFSAIAIKKDRVTGVKIALLIIFILSAIISLIFLGQYLNLYTIPLSALVFMQIIC